MMMCDDDGCSIGCVEVVTALAACLAPADWLLHGCETEPLAVVMIHLLASTLFATQMSSQVITGHFPLPDCSWLIHTNTWQLPVVLFTKRPRALGHELAPLKIIGPVPFTYKTTVKQRAGRPHAPVEMTRTMLPLRLAWALTIHRSQVNCGIGRQAGRQAGAEYLFHCGTPTDAAQTGPSHVEDDWTCHSGAS